MQSHQHHQVDQRSLLFGPRAHRRPQQNQQTNLAANEREMLEAANIQQVDGLRGRVGEMRHLALNLGNEVRDQNALLDDMRNNFDTVHDGVKRTITEVKRLASSGSPGHLCALFLFAFIFLILVYLLIKL